jgi:hypothetical protein
MIRLYTDKWEYKAKKEGDEHFSTFLEGVKEGSGELPSELRLEGSVGEIVEEAWDDYKKLYSMNNVVQITYKLYQALDSRVSLSYRMYEMSKQYKLSFWKIAPIMNIVNDIRGWELYINLDMNEQFITCVGAFLHSDGVNLASMERWGILCDELVGSNEWASHIGIFNTLAKSVLDGPNKEVVDKFVLGLIYLAYQNVARRDRSLINLYDFQWSRINAMISMAGYDKLEELRPLYELALVLSSSYHTIELDPMLFAIHKLQSDDRIELCTSIARGSDLVALYRSIWTSVPSKLDLASIGLGNLVQEGCAQSMPETPGLQLLYMAHTMVEDLVLSWKDSKEYNYLPMFVAALGCVVAGNLGLSCIIKKIRNTETTCNSLYMFRVYAEKFVAQYDTPVSTAITPSVAQKILKMAALLSK